MVLNVQTERDFLNIPPIHFIKEKNESQRGDLTYLRSHTSRDAIFIWLGFYHSTSFPWNLAQIPWDRSKPEAKITFQSSTFTSIPTLQALSLPIEHTRILLLFFFLFLKKTFFFFLCIIQVVYPSTSHQHWWTQSNIFSHFRTLARPAERLLSVSSGIQGRCEGNQFSWIWKKTGSHSIQLAVSSLKVLKFHPGKVAFDLWQWLPGVPGQNGWQMYYLFSLYQLRHLLWICSWIYYSANWNAIRNVLVEILGS